MLGIRIENLSKSFRLSDGSAEQTVIRGIDLEVAAGESVAFMGPSGSGKSTLLNMIAGLESPSQGRVFIGNTELTALKNKEKEFLRLQTLSYVFQFFHLLPTLTALENCALVAIEQGLRDPKDIIADAYETLRRLGLEGAEHKRPSQLSGGMQARAALARALVARPKIVLADEPTGNLDSRSGEWVLDLLFEEQKKRGFTLLLVTHDEKAANRASRIVRLRDGQLIT
ncbi:MAG: Lipoprotein-releasing system ATP-binding protein LolD [Pseudomonadota bacterium]|jgi:ABC-type lipoprotein export system ATPase subunit